MADMADMADGPMPMLYINTLLPAGSDAARKALRSCSWTPDQKSQPEVIGRRGATPSCASASSGAAPAIGCAMESRFDVLLVPTSHRKHERSAADDAYHIRASVKKRWRRSYLTQKMGYTAIKSDTVVMDATSLRILVVYVREDRRRGADAATNRSTDAATMKRLADGRSIQPRFLAAMKNSYDFNPMRNNDTAEGALFVHGFRFANSACFPKKVDMYSTPQNKTPMEPETTAVMASCVSDVERSVCPSMHKQRVQAAKSLLATGATSLITPALSLERCPAFAITVSVGYALAPHTDDPKAQIVTNEMRNGKCAETVMFSSNDVDHRQGWCFCSLEAGVVLDLCDNGKEVAHGGRTTFVMVNPSDIHGTPLLENGSMHGGTGVAITNKASLLSPNLRCAVSNEKSGTRRGTLEVVRDIEIRAATYRRQCRPPVPVHVPVNAASRTVTRAMESASLPCLSTTRSSDHDSTASAANNRLYKLQSRLASARVPQHLIDGCIVTLTRIDGRRSDRKRAYSYSHKTIGGGHICWSGLSKAKCAIVDYSSKHGTGATRATKRRRL